LGSKAIQLNCVFKGNDDQRFGVGFTFGLDQIILLYEMYSTYTMPTYS
jgi:hypothetical protein